MVLVLDVSLSWQKSCQAILRDQPRVVLTLSLNKGTSFLLRSYQI